jgi:DNA-binding MarR family transcriptional regulator
MSMQTHTSTAVENDDVARLRSSIGKLARRLRPTEAADGLTPTQISVLLTIVRFDSLRIGELAAHEDLNPTMLSRMLAVLTERGLVRRVPAPDDRRGGVVAATPAGRRLRARMRKERNEKLAPVLAELGDTDRDALIAALPALEALAELLKPRAPA